MSHVPLPAPRRRGSPATLHQRPTRDEAPAVVVDWLHTRNLTFNVFSTVLVTPGVSRAALSAALGASASSVGKSVRSLTGTGLLREAAPVVEGLGRPRTPLTVNADHEHVAGLHVGPDRVRGLLCDLSLEPLVRAGCPLPSHRPEDVVGACAKVLEELLTLHPASRDLVHSIGVSTAGHVDGMTGIVRRSYALGWAGVHLRAMLERATGLHVLVHNEADVMALFEQWFGHLRAVPWAAVVLVGPTVDAGLILDGDLYFGATSLAGAIGHLPVQHHRPRRCPCGRRGCLECAVGDRGLLQRVLEHRPDGRASTLEEALLAANRGEDWALRPLAEAGSELGGVLAMLANVLNPLDIVVLGDSITACDVLREATLVAFESESLMPIDQVRLTVAPVADDAWGQASALSALRYRIVNSLTS